MVSREIRVSGFLEGRKEKKYKIELPTIVRY
jgi:hypothetical protein